MKSIYKLFSFILIILTLTSCQFISNTNSYTDKSVQFLEHLLDGKIDDSYNQFALENDAFKNTDKDALKEGLYQFRSDLISQYGKEIEFSFLGATKTTYTTQQHQFPNVTVLNIAFENDTDYGRVEFIFDDNTGKILNVTPDYAKLPIPSMTLHYVCIILGLIILAFNIYTIIKVKRSNFKRKWMIYIGIIFLNFPTIIYNTSTGFDYQIFKFQFFGFGIDAFGTYFSNVFLSLPIGAIYWFWKVNQLKKEEEFNQFAEDLINN